MGEKNSTKSYSRTKGIMLILTILTGSILGSIRYYCSVCVSEKNLSVEWLTVVRLLLAGILLLAFSYRKERIFIWEIWKDRRDRLSLILFSVLGMLSLQYTFLAGIQHGNAATATVIQFLGPAVITCYLAIRSKRIPTLKEASGVSLAILGTFFLVTRGNIHSLSISG
ncbi:DMT family transporter [Bacillus spizizenii]|nr:DMT family transporter [Bacillus spizizenii]